MSSLRLVFGAGAVLVVLVGAIAVALSVGDDDGDGRDGSGPEEVTVEGTLPETPSTSGVDVSTTLTEPLAEGDVPAPGSGGVGVDSLISIENPVALVDTDEAGGVVLVATQAGRVHRVDFDSGASDVVLDLSDRVSDGTEQGLLGMAVDPPGERLYVNYTDTDGNTDVRSFSLAELGGEGRRHFQLEQPFANHNGGHLAFDVSGDLWIGTGDGGGGGDPGDEAQDPESLLGKMLRVVPLADGGVRGSDANSVPGGADEVWAIGLRNPWRYSFDRLTGDLWVADVGQGDVEEVSVIPSDASAVNFGWDDVEGDAPFEGGLDPSFVTPVVTYGHDDGCSVTGGYVYRGDDVASLYGWYVYGDYCGGWIRAVTADAPTSDPVEIASDIGQVRSFAELADGELVVLTNEGVSLLVDTASSLPENGDDQGAE